MTTLCDQDIDRAGGPMLTIAHRLRNAHCPFVLALGQNIYRRSSQTASKMFSFFSAHGPNSPMVKIMAISSGEGRTLGHPRSSQGAPASEEMDEPEARGYAL
jgi:hypothetical protein